MILKKTIEVGLAGLYLARGERERGLNYLSKFIFFFLELFFIFFFL